MRARDVGFAYLLAVLGDVALSAIANVDDSLTTATYLYSAFVTAFGTVAFMMAILGRLRPAAAFIVPAIFYAVVMVFGYFVGMTVAIKTRAHQMRAGETLTQEQLIVSSAEVAAVFPWWTTVNWVLIGLDGVIAVVCLAAFAIASRKKPPEAVAVAPMLPR